MARKKRRTRKALSRKARKAGYVGLMYGRADQLSYPANLKLSPPSGERPGAPPRVPRPKEKETGGSTKTKR